MRLVHKYYPIILIIAAGVIVRLFFSIGHIFSDDAYYSYLSYTLLRGDFANDYLGYPIFPLRITYLSIISFSYTVFGVNEFATIVLPFIVSVGNLFLVYKLAKIFTDNNDIAILSMFLIAFFPTDIVFATINFVDSPNTFIINAGIYYLYKSYKTHDNKLAIIAGVLFFLSMQIKENIYYTAILLIILWIYINLKNKEFNSQILIAIPFIILNLFVEGFVYLIVHNDFVYRFTVLQQNYNYSYYDFFPYTAQKFSGVKNYWGNLFDQIFIINGKAVFLRRFYLFLPLLSSVKSILNIRKKEYLLLTYWFLGSLILLIAFTTSFTTYKPLDLQRSWYIYPLLMPMIILSAIFLNSFRKKVKFLLLTVYMVGGIIMCTHYEIYFDKQNISELKSFIKENPYQKIFADHFTKYSVDLLRNYSDLSNSERISGKNFNWKNIEPGDWVLYNIKHIVELQWQKYEFPDFSKLKSSLFSEVKRYGDFIIYEKMR